MTSAAAIAGSGWRIGRPFLDRPDAVVRQAVLAALTASRMSIEEIDSFVTVASDTLDGMSVPGRAEIAGAYGRRYLNVPSAAGHGLAAAAIQIEAGEARNLLLVGWGAATKLGDHDGRGNQADPFYARPIGATPQAIGLLQAQELMDADGMNRDAVAAYTQDMTARAWGADVARPAGSAPSWARSAFCDGAVAIVLRPARNTPGEVTVRDFSQISRPYCPEDERLDTAVWAREAMAGLSAGAAPTVVEAAAPTPVAEFRALGAIGNPLANGGALFNRSGGGACAYFGAATGLRQVAEAGRLLAEKAADGKGGSALVLDLCGPAGQHVTAMVLQSGAKP